MARVQHSGRRPLAQRPLISIYPPSPHYGGHVLHILGRLGAGGGVSSRDWWGTDGEPHPVYPLSSSAPSGEGGNVPRALQDEKVSSHKRIYCLFPPLVEEAGWPGELL